VRKRKRLLIVLLLSAVAVSGCCLGPWGTTYPPLGPVTRIEVKAGLNDKQVRVIDDPAEVQRVVEFVDGHRRGWGWLSDWAGVPVPQVSADFYNGSEFKGHFGVGPGFFECQREGDFASKHCWGPQERRFLELVGLPDYQFRR
jgi:hypothetical protein